MPISLLRIKNFNENFDDNVYESVKFFHSRNYKTTQRVYHTSEKNMKLNNDKIRGENSF